MKTSGLFSSKRREAFKRLLEKDGINTKQTGIPQWQGDRARAPLSFAQQRLWLIDQMQPGSFGYNMPSAFRMKGALDVRILEHSLNEVMQRHETLRTSFHVLEDTQPVQVIAAQATFSLPCIDLQHLPESERETAAMRLAIEEAQSPFDLTKGSLLRGKLLRVGAEDHILLLTTHHIVSDGWSISVLSREAIMLYAAFSQNQPSPLPELSIQYADFAAWQRDWLQGERLEKLQTYWQKSLEAMPALELPTNHPRPELTSYRGANLATSFSPALTDQLKAFSQSEGISLFTTLLTGFMTVLLRYTGQPDIVIRTPVANRTRQQTEALIGYFVNILALRADLSGNPTFRDALRRVNDACQGAFAHQDLPFEQVLEDLKPMRHGRGPLFPVMFILQNISLDAPNVPGGTFSPLLVDSGLALFDLTVTAMDTLPALKINFNYNTDLFEAATIQTMMEDFKATLEEILVEPAQHLDALIARIPDHHIPVERSSLTHEMDALREKAALVAPRNETERTLVEIWQDVLGIPQLGIHNNFFELGGDSLAAMRAIAKAHQAGLHFTPQDLYLRQTIAELAAKPSSAPVPAIEQAHISGPMKLTAAQKRFLKTSMRYPNRYNIANLVEIPAGVAPQAIEEIVRYLYNHHDALRTRFIQTEDGWRQIIAAPDENAPVPFSYIDFSNLPRDQHTDAIERTAEELQGSLNLVDGPLMRVALFNMGEKQAGRLLIILHHLIYDANSSTFFDDFYTLTQQLSQGEALQLPPKTAPLWQYLEQLDAYTRSPELHKELDYWLSLPLTELVSLPMDFPADRAKNVWGSAQNIPARLSREETETLLREIPKAYNVQVSDILVAALVQTLTAWGNGRWLMFDTVDFGRNAIPNAADIDLSRTVGWFSMESRFTLERNDDEQLKDVLMSIKAQIQNIPNRGAGFELLRYNDENIPGLEKLPQPEVLFNYLGRQQTRNVNLKPAYEYAGQLCDPRDQRHYLLECLVVIFDGSLVTNWHYSKNLYQRATVKKLAENYIAWLRTLVTQYVASK